MSSTIHPGTMIVASAYPDPPFELIENGQPSGFDVQLISAVCAQMGLTLQRVRFQGENFNDIFDGLENGTYDVVISGTTITPDRAALVLFSQPYLEFNQGLRLIGNAHPTSLRRPICMVSPPAFKSGTRRTLSPNAGWPTEPSPASDTTRTMASPLRCPIWKLDRSAWSSNCFQSFPG